MGRYLFAAGQATGEKRFRSWMAGRAGWQENWIARKIALTEPFDTNRRQDVETVDQTH
jgi:hypothetical protein